MKKRFFKGVSIFLASVLTVGMCSGYRVDAKTKFSVPKNVTLSYDKNGVNSDFYTNTIWIKGTNNSNADTVQRNITNFKSSNKKVVSTKTIGKDYCPVSDFGNSSGTVGIGVKLKKTGTTKISFKIRYKKKTYSLKTTLKVIKYANPFKKIMGDKKNITSDYNVKRGSGITTYGFDKISVTPNKNWKIKSAYTFKVGGNGKKKTLKGSSFTVKSGYRVVITMENKKTKASETVYFAQ